MLVTGVILGFGQPVAAGVMTSKAEPSALTEVWAVHGQFTYVEQEVSGFNAPYAGAGSLTPRRGKETTDLSFYVGARPWSGAEFWINPEID